MKKILAFTLSIFIVASTLISCSEKECEHVDENKDHICAICGENVGAHADRLDDTDHKCDYCQAVLSLCVDEDKNHLCDVCQEKISECLDKNNDAICDECKEKMSTSTARVEKFGVTIDTFPNNLFNAQYNVATGEVDISSLNQNIIVAPGTHDVIDIESSIFGTPEVAVTVITDAKVVLSGWTVNNEFYCPIVFKIGASSDTFVEIESSDYESEDALIQAIESEIEKATIKYYDAGTKIPNNTKIPLYFSWEWKFEEGNDMSDTALGNNSPQPNISISITQSIEQAQTYN